LAGWYTTESTAIRHKHEVSVKKNFNSATNITTLISKATEITGDVHFSGALEVEGKVFGNIYADDDSSAEVRVRECGLVKGEIQAPLIIINGMVEGDVYSSNHIELAAKARVHGNVYYHLIEMVMGSEVNGSLCHKSAAEMLPRQLQADSAAQCAPSEHTGEFIHE
jgi:cytoskeletal protein CcmA (bactofilin family)